MDPIAFVLTSSFTILAIIAGAKYTSYQKMQNQARIKDAGIEEARVKKLQSQAASKIQRVWRRHQIRINFSWQDLLWMNEHDIALRNNAAAAGFIERDKGGYGDAYSLANLNLLMSRSSLSISFDMANIYKVRYSAKLKRELTQTMDKHLSYMINQSLPMYMKTNIFHIMSIEDAKHSISFDKPAYPTGKCGSQAFNNKQILATIQEGLYFSSPNHQSIRTACAGHRFPKKTFDPVPEQANWGVVDYIQKSKNFNCRTNYPTPELIKEIDRLRQQESRAIQTEIVQTIKKLRRA